MTIDRSRTCADTPAPAERGPASVVVSLLKKRQQERAWQHRGPTGDAMCEAFRKAAATRPEQGSDQPDRRPSLRPEPGPDNGHRLGVGGTRSAVGRSDRVTTERKPPVVNALIRPAAPQARGPSGSPDRGPGLAENAAGFSLDAGAFPAASISASAMNGVTVPSSWPAPGIMLLHAAPPIGGTQAGSTRQEVRDDELRLRLERALAELHRQAAEAAGQVRFDPQDARELAHRLAAGVVEGVAQPRGTRSVDIVLGVDFGTSSTKIVARLPYEAGAPAFAVPAPFSARAEEHAHLWASRIWLDASGLFSLAPVEAAPAHCAIKAALMQADGERAIVLRSGAWAATALEAATAFLALQLRQARGWLLSRKEDALSAGPLRWSYHVGFPAASLDKNGLRERYAAACTAALSLSLLGLPITPTLVRVALRVVPTTTTALDKLGISLVPEISAAITGFARSPKREDGLYAMVDVGAGTVDCCTFDLWRPNDGAMTYPIFKADVAMLGVEP